MIPFWYTIVSFFTATPEFRVQIWTYFRRISSNSSHTVDSLKFSLVHLVFSKPCAGRSQKKKKCCATGTGPEKGPANPTRPSAKSSGRENVLAPASGPYVWVVNSVIPRSSSAVAAMSAAAARGLNSVSRAALSWKPVSGSIRRVPKP